MAVPQLIYSRCYADDVLVIHVQHATGSVMSYQLNAHLSPTNGLSSHCVPLCGELHSS